MAGNVAEWVLDRWDHERYAREEASGPVVSDPVDPLPLSGDRTPADKAVVRGGHWQDSACGLFSARRVPMEPGTRSATVGFR